MPSVPPVSMNDAEAASPAAADTPLTGHPLPGSGPASATGAVSRSIARRLLFWFLMIAIIPAALLTAITARIASSTLEESLRDKLVRTAASKANELEAFALERLRDGRVLSSDPSLILATRDLGVIAAREVESGNAPGGGVARLRTAINESSPGLAAFLGHAASTFGYSHLLVIDGTGRVVFALDDAIPLGSSVLTGGAASTPLASSFERSRTSLQTELSGFQAHGAEGKPVAFVTSPIINEGTVIGVLALGLGPQRVWQILSDLSGLGTTGELVTGERQGNNVLITAPLRHEGDAAFRKIIPLGSTRGTATQRAADGESGYGPVIDYRGQHVVAA